LPFIFRAVKISLNNLIYEKEMKEISNIIKRNKPVLLDALPRLIARLSPTHPKMEELKNQLYRTGAGYSGECNVDSYLERAQFTRLTRIFTDVHLETSNNFTFQIDTLIVTERYVLIVEVKNITGTVRFVQNPPHLLRELDNGNETIMDCPVYQLSANKVNLDDWFQQRGYKIKTAGLLVLANQNTVVKDVPPDFPILYKKQLPYYLRNFQPNEPIFSVVQIQDISRKIQDEQQQFNPFPLCSYYNIDTRSLKEGLLCRYCNGLLQRKNRETWHCLLCKKNGEDPYNDGINDWFLLVKNSIRNEECRKFLQLKDKHSTYYALKNSNLLRKGNSIASFYISRTKKV